MGIRESYHDTESILSEDGSIIGINLGYDFTAEHECGIRQLQEDFGLKIGKKYGFEGRKNNIVPKGFARSINRHGHMLVYPTSLLDILLTSNREPLIIGKDGIWTAWCEHSFAVAVTEEYSGIIECLYDAFNGKNGIIMLSGRSTPFSGNGLMLLDYRLIPKETKKEFYECDKKYQQEQKMFRKLEKKSGIFELLKKSGKQYLFLGIKELDKNGEPLWWLNTWSEGNYGWYKTEDLRQWAENKGPVVKLK